ncbi:hypothetical protein BY458DRAFT_530803 [Sporodiniella umbellata]|nr:hypothetical protein BY458DRAFT_530803 [Sporodiniella umbellata]
MWKGFVLICFLSFVWCQEACQKLHMIYPKEGSSFRLEKGSIYMVMGNGDGFLTQVTLVESDTQKSNTVWTGRDELSKVSVVQHDLSKLQLGSSTTFQFRVLAEENGRTCRIDSAKFTLH